MKKTIKKISFIGAGNVATHLALALYRAGYETSQIYSRTEVSAKMLTDKINTTYTTCIEELKQDSDLYILSLADQATEQIAGKLRLTSGIVVHTAGSLPMAILKGAAKNYGVFYPFQTFSKKVSVDFKQIPVCIEANNEETSNLLCEVASDITAKVLRINSEQRAFLHLCGVFSCNFVNHMLSIADKFCDKQHLDFSLLEPLVKETIKKAFTNKPSEVQTGPAVRNDRNIIKKQIDLLSCEPKIQDIYKLLSQSIFEFSDECSGCF